MSTHTKLVDALTSQVGRKLLTGITGVLLVLFVIVHLAGNFALLRSDPDPFNKYTEFLHGFGTALIVVEVLLGLLILLHAYLGIVIWLRKRKARAQGYEVYQSKGGPSRQTLSSRSMIITGIVLLVFITIHVIQFRFGPNVADGYTSQIAGEEVRDLYRLVIETFSNIWWVIFYVGSVLLLGFHLRHGIWSAFQSLGAMKPRVSSIIFGIALVLGVLLAIGFVVLPIWIYLQRGVA